jgi:hypothetical protein
VRTHVKILENHPVLVGKGKIDWIRLSDFGEAQLRRTSPRVKSSHVSVTLIANGLLKARQTSWPSARETLTSTKVTRNKIVILYLVEKASLLLYAFAGCLRQWLVVGYKDTRRDILFGRSISWFSFIWHSRLRLPFSQLKSSKIAVLFLGSLLLQ